MFLVLDRKPKRNLAETSATENEGVKRFQRARANLDFNETSKTNHYADFSSREI